MKAISVPMAEYEICAKAGRALRKFVWEAVREIKEELLKLGQLGSRRWEF